VPAIDPAADPQWDRFVERSSGRFAHAYHLAAWREVHRRAYGRAPIYLGVRDRDGQLTGGLPLVVHGGALRGLAASLIPGRSAAGARPRLSSVIRGGPLGDDIDARAELLRQACALVDEGGYSDLRLQTDVAGCEQLVPGLRAVPDSPAWLTQLPRDPDELLSAWRKQSRNLWRNLAKARQRGVVVRPVRSRIDLWRFYRQYVQAMSRHRAVPRSWLEIRIAHRLLAPSGRCQVWLGEYQGEIVAGAMCLSAGSSFEMLYAGSEPRANDLRPMHAVYWHAIEWAIATGKTIVDWGTAPLESSLGNYKRQWGADPVPSFQYMYAPGTDPPAPPSEAPAVDTGDSGGGLWDRVPTDALGVAATIAHRVL
jgi:CelD/BcsL family acetyltransferase involved in cellulose biosynthesis